MDQKVVHSEQVKMPDSLWFNVEEGIQRHEEIGMLEWICHLRPTHSPWEGPETYPSP